MKLEMKRQDLEELYILLEVYERTYGGRNVREMKEEVSAKYSEKKGGGNIWEKRNPRGQAGKDSIRKKKESGSENFEMKGWQCAE